MNFIYTKQICLVRYEQFQRINITYLVIWVGLASLKNHGLQHMVDLVLKPELILLSLLLSLLRVVRGLRVGAWLPTLVCGHLHFKIL